MKVLMNGQSKLSGGRELLFRVSIQRFGAKIHVAHGLIEINMELPLSMELGGKLIT